MKRAGLVILISGRGSNMGAIVEAVQSGTIPAEVRAVISTRTDAPGLKIAQSAGVTTHVVAHNDYSLRSEFEAALMRAIDGHDPQLVVLAGFMRVLTFDFVQHYHQRLINIHPSLLPEFPGRHTHERALAAGARRHGATVHFVTPEVDSGPIIIQATVSILPTDTAESLAERVLEQEHHIYPRAVRWFVEGRLSIRDRRVLLDGAVRVEQGIVEPAAAGSKS